MLTRRSFLKTTAAAAAGTALSARSWGQVAGANGTVRVAVVGLNGRGRSHVPDFRAVPGVKVVALCDVDSAVLAKASADFSISDTTREFRTLLARSDIDAVTLATPHHWHALQTVWACQAGKDVYVEKPVSHEVWEGQQMIAAIRKYNRIAQAGSQARSSPAIAEAVAWVQAGHLGKVTASRGLCYKRRPSIGHTIGPQPVPKTVDYDVWLGPAPYTPLRRAKLHYDWHWFWDTGNGDIGNQGIHQMDVARWFLGDPGAPPSVLSVGGRFGYVDDAQTPNTLASIHNYEAAPLIFEVRGLPSKTGAKDMDSYMGTNVGNIVHCEGGHVLIPALNYTWAQAFDRDGKMIQEFRGGASHQANFIQAVRSRRTADLHIPVANSHLSSCLCHFSNISHRLGQAAQPEELREKVKANAGLAEASGRMQEHLRANGVDLGQTPAMLGCPLQLDAASQSFVGNPAANALLTHDYRPPYVVPDEV